MRRSRKRFCKMDTNATEKKNEEIALKMFEMAKYEYEDEKQRIQNIDSRTTGLFNVASIIITLILAFKANEVKVITAGWLQYVDDAISIMSMLFLAASVIFFLLSLTTRAYKNVNLQEALHESNFDLSYFDVLYKQAATYEDLTLKNRSITDKKIEDFNSGLRFLAIGFILVALKYLMIYMVTA